MDDKMNEDQRLQLQKMISANNVEDYTGLIRQLKHSHVLRENVNNLMLLKAKYPNEEDKDALHLEAMLECNFLFTYYTDIYNKIRKDEMDLTILFSAFDVLRDIEDGKLGQHDGSYKFGLLLKEIYVDSALKRAEKLNAETGETEKEYKGPQVEISWAEFKQKEEKKRLEQEREKEKRRLEQERKRQEQKKRR